MKDNSTISSSFYMNTFIIQYGTWDFLQHYFCHLTCFFSRAEHRPYDTSNSSRYIIFEGFSPCLFTTITFSYGIYLCLISIPQHSSENPEQHSSLHISLMSSQYTTPDGSQGSSREMQALNVEHSRRVRVKGFCFAYCKLCIAMLSSRE